MVKYSEKEIFCEKSKVAQETLRNHYLKKENILYECSICHISDWLNSPLVLRLDHINGDNHDNRLENLRWLCPNCDSQQETYCGKNKKHHIEKPKKYCKICGIELSSTSKVDYCQEHWLKYGQRVILDRPSREELKEMIRKEPFTAISLKYNVCDNTIRKWCDAYQLPRKVTEIKKISDEDWEKI